MRVHAAHPTWLEPAQALTRIKSGAPAAPVSDCGAVAIRPAALRLRHLLEPPPICHVRWVPPLRIMKGAPASGNSVGRRMPLPRHEADGSSHQRLRLAGLAHLVSPVRLPAADTGPAPVRPAPGRGPGYGHPRRSRRASPSRLTADPMAAAVPRQRPWQHPQAPLPAEFFALFPGLLLDVDQGLAPPAGVGCKPWRGPRSLALSPPRR